MSWTAKLQLIIIHSYQWCTILRVSTWTIRRHCNNNSNCLQQQTVTAMSMFHLSVKRAFEDIMYIVQRQSSRLQQEQLHEVFTTHRSSMRFDIYLVLHSNIWHSHDSTHSKEVSDSCMYTMSSHAALLCTSSCRYKLPTYKATHASLHTSSNAAIHVRFYPVGQHGPAYDHILQWS